MFEDIRSERSVDEIFAEIDNLEIDNIELHSDAIGYLATLQGYLNCFDKLQELYHEVDPDHELVNNDTADIRLVRQQLSMSGAPVQNLVELYEVAETIYPVFVAKVEGILMKITNDLGLETSDIEFKLPPGESKLKGKIRASEKAHDNYSANDHGPPESWLFDIVRGSVVFGSAEQLLQFFKIFQEDSSIEIVKSKNRFRNPTITGYRDWNLQFQMSSTDSGIKHICEIQLHHKAIKEASVKLGSHKFYEFFRSYYAGATGTLEECLNDFRLICKGASLDAAFLREVVEKPLEKVRMERIADLFENHLNHYQLALIITRAAKNCLEPVVLYFRMGNLFLQQFKLEEAMVMYREVDVHLNALGAGAGSAEAYVYQNMGTALHEQGKLREAMAMYQKAMDIEMKESTETPELYVSMGNIALHQGKLDEALGLYQDALDIQWKISGNADQLTADIYNNKGCVFREQGEYTRAIAMHQQALKIQLKTLGQDHFLTGSTFDNVAQVLCLQGRLDGATSMYEKALRIRLQTLGRYHVDTAHSFCNLGIVLRSRGNLDEAMKMYQKALEIRLKLGELGEHNKDTACTYHKMANILVDQGKFEESLALFQKALDFRLETTGEYHEHTATTYNDMGRVLTNLGILDLATTMYEKALEIRLEVFGEAHKDTARSCHILGAALHNQGELEEAILMYQEALNIRLQVLGQDHEDTAATYSNMACALAQQHKYEEATAMCQNALAIHVMVLGRHHPTTLQNLLLLESIQKAVTQETLEADI